MQISVNKLSPVLVEFDVQVEADRVKREMDKAYTSLSRSARVRGYRPGKAPRKILAHVYGARIAADVVQRLVDETFPQAVSEQNLQPVSSPDIEPQKLIDNEPFSYKARFEVVPEIPEVKYDGLTAERPKLEASSEQIDEELERLRRAHATLESPKQARGAQKEDTVTIDFDVEVAGETVKDAGATDFQVEIGANSLIPEIEAALMGKKAGDSAEASVEMPAQHPHPQLQGKTAIFKLTIKDLKERVLPAADDEFAKDLGEFETLEELKKDLKQGIEKQLKEQADNNVAEQLVLELVKHNPIPLPPTLVERQMRLTEQEILMQARRQGNQVSGVGDELRTKIQNDSEVKVRAGLLMAAIAKKEGIKIGDAEIEEGLAELAEQSGKNVAKLRVEYREPKKREILLGMILENKVLDIIEAKAKISDA